MNTRVSIAILLVMMAIFSLTGCKNKGEGFVQPVSANANNDIMDQYFYGEAMNETSLHEIVVEADESIYYFGYFNGRKRVGRISPDGQLSWHVDYPGILDMYFVPSLFEPSEKALIAVGWATTGDDSPDHALISVFSEAGNLCAQESIGDPEHQLWFNGIQQISSEPDQSRFMVVGGATRNGIDYPFAAMLAIRNDSTISVERDTIMTSRAGQYLRFVVSNGNELSPRFYSIFIPMSGSHGVLCFDDLLGIVWEKSLEADSNEEQANHIAFYDGSVFIAGNSVMKKDDYNWSAAYIASINEIGEFNWSHIVALSQYSDSYLECFIYDGMLGATGVYSQYYWTNVNRCFGYAVASFFDLETGEAIMHQTFGNEKCRSGFNSVWADNGRFIFAGYTNFYFGTYRWFQGWLVKADKAVTSTGTGDGLQEIDAEAATCEPLPDGNLETRQ